MTRSQLIAAATAGSVLVTAVAATHANAPSHLELAALGAGLGAIVATDLYERRIPNIALIITFACCFTIAVTQHETGYPSVEALVVVAVLFAIAFAQPAALGMGDAKLALLIAVTLNRTAATALLLGLVLAALAALTILARTRAAARRQALPLAPFLAAGVLVALAGT